MQVLGLGTLVFSSALLGMGLASSYWHLVVCRYCTCHDQGQAIHIPDPMTMGYVSLTFRNCRMLIAAGESVCRWVVCTVRAFLTQVCFQADVWLLAG